MKNDSTEFLVKTNKDVDEWMDGFYTDGRKADFRLHCQWAWQEQERRHNTTESDLLSALESCAGWLEWLDDPRSCLGDGHKKVIKQTRSAIAKAKGLKP